MGQWGGLPHFSRARDTIPAMFFPCFFGGMTSYSTFIRKYTSAKPIFVKIGTIVHFDNTSSQKKILMTSLRQKCRNRSEFFYVTLYRKNEQSCQFLRKSVQRKCIFWKTSDMTPYPKKWWRHNSVKNVGIDLNFLRWIFYRKIESLGQFLAILND